MKSFCTKVFMVAFALALPMVAAAQDVGGILNLLAKIHAVISAAIPVLIALAVLAFMWGIVMYLFGKKEDGRSMMLWGIIALFVMTSVWGLVGILRGTLFGDNPDPAQNVNIPQINGNNE